MQNWISLFSALTLALSTVRPVLAANYDVDVGPGLVFSPDHLDDVVPEDTVTFHFIGGTHSATQSTLEDPCSPMSGGFDSGIMTSGEHLVTVVDTNPIWVYCRVSSHCQSGMVFAVNADSASLAQFQGTATGNPPSAGGSSSTTEPPSSESTEPASPSTTTTPNGASHVQNVLGGFGLSVAAAALGAAMV